MAPLPVQEALRRLVAIPSVFPNEAAVTQFIEQTLIAAGCSVSRVETAPGRQNLVATTATAKRYLGFYGHMDTVPPDRTYSRDPYTMVVEGDTARGLGVCDMKGGLACMLHVAAYGVAHNLPLKLVFGVDEEDISRGAYTLARSGMLNDLHFLVVAESGQVIPEGAPYTIGYGRKGRIVFEAAVSGQKAHAAEAHKGVNAIEQAARLVSLLAELRFPSHPRLGPSTVVPQLIEGSADAFSVPDACRLVFSLLSSPGTTSSDVISQLTARAAEAGIAISVSVQPRETPYCEAYEIDLSAPLLKTFEAQIFARDRVAPEYNASVADECIFAHHLKIPVLSVGPVGGGDHTASEWVSLSSLERTARVFEEMATLGAGEGR